MLVGGVNSERFVVKQGYNLITEMLTAACFATEQLASVRLCLNWLGYEGTVGGVNAVKRDNITKIFTLQTSVLAVVILAATELTFLLF